MLKELTIDGLLKRRPQAIRLLRESRIDTWSHLHTRLEEVLVRRGVDVQAFAEALKALRPPESVDDWSSQPLYCLLDHLVNEHRAYFHPTLSEIRHLLEIQGLVSGGDVNLLKQVHTEFLEFSRQLESNMTREEETLFPGILRVEACLEDERIQPEFHRGSVNVNIALLRFHSGKQMAAMKRLESSLGSWREDESRMMPGTSEVFSLIEALMARVSAHTQLEESVLYPRADDNERKLYNLFISGGRAATAAQA